MTEKSNGTLGKAAEDLSGTLELADAVATIDGQIDCARAAIGEQNALIYMLKKQRVEMIRLSKKGPALPLGVPPLVKPSDSGKPGTS